GSSMTENFKPSELDELFDVNTIKLPFSGATYKEINDSLKVVMEHNNNVKVVVRGLDYVRMFDEASRMTYDDSEYPYYIYDDKLLNDVNYLYNKGVLINTAKVLLNTVTGAPSKDFDSYSYWNDNYSYGAEAVKQTYSRPETFSEIVPLSDEDYKNIYENITQNVTSIAAKNPETEFYIFISPYSIYYFDRAQRNGVLDKHIDAEKYITELLLEQDNINVFSFYDDYEMICNMDNYRDIAHYGAEINSQILVWMKEGKHQLTKENYLQYYDNIREFLKNYNYDTLFE
ncbi:MAG: hypothetical protein J6C76_05490, partial [Oscillospiraceae bacterium]|nr:hypothetical protein [Oscillospiraceae bacterium]